MALLPRRGGGRRRNPIALAVAGLIVAAVALSYAIGFARDSIEVVDHSEAGIAKGTLAVCGGRTTVALRRLLTERDAWRATPAHICPGVATVTLTLKDGTVDSCTGFALKGEGDLRVLVDASGCHGFDSAVLPVLP